jgi:hypothetical protein
MNIQMITGLTHTLASYLANSKLGLFALRGIAVIDLIQMSVDLWGL